MDNDSKLFLSLRDLIAFLSNRGISFEEESLRRVIHNFDKDEDFSINFNEFLSIILPRKNDQLKIETEQRKPDENNQEEKDKAIDQTIYEAFANLLQKELDIVKKLANIAEDIKLSKDFTTYESFLAIVHDEKYITKENMGVFLNEHNVFLEERDIETLMFRIDSDADGKISYEEFQEIFFPYKNIISNIEKNKDFSSSNTFKSTNKYEYQYNQPLESTTYHSPRNKNLNIKTSQNQQEMYKDSMINYSQNSIFNKVSNSPLNYTMNNSNNNFSSSNNDVNYRAKLKTYTTPKKNDDYCRSSPSFSLNERKQSPSCHFERKERFSPIRTKVIPSPQKNSPKLSPYRASSPNRCCIHCCCHPCSCCCVEDRKRKNLFSLLNDMLQQDSLIENIKESLAFCTDANLPDLFEFFDYSQKNGISPIDLSQACKELGMFLSLDELKILYKRFDKDLDGRFE